MDSLPDKNIVDEALERICSHKLFKRSHTNEVLLRFLVEQAYKGVDVKEQTIGQKLFKDDYNADTNDSKIRVAVYYLRKKLDAYYNDSGKEEDIRFEIKKGQYNLSFIKPNNTDQQQIKSSKGNSSFTKKVLVISSILLGILIIALVLPLLQTKNVYCWDDFFNKDASNICVISDHFVVKDIDNSYHKYSLYRSIRNEEDLLAFNKENPDSKLELSHFSLFSKMAPFATQTLTQWFAEHAKSFTIRLESELRFADFKENNLIFIGQAKNMILTKSLFLESSKRFTKIDGGYSFHSGDTSKKYTANINGNKYKEYALVSVAQLDHGKKAIFFESEHDIGVMATVRKFTNKEWLNEFYQQFPDSEQRFNALFEVVGISRSDVVCRLIELELLD